VESDLIGEFYLFLEIQFRFKIEIDVNIFQKCLSKRKINFSEEEFFYWTFDHK
jgi:hypothetical protein